MSAAFNLARSNPSDSAWTPGALIVLNRKLQARSAHELLRWGLEIFGKEIVLGTGFGPSGVVLIHMAAQLQPRMTIFYLDTNLLFPETHTLREELARRLGVRFTAVQTHLSLEQQAASHGPELWQRDPDRCCALRKIAPLRRFLADKGAWISGLRRDHSPIRSRTPLVEWSATYGVLKLNPLAFWSNEQVWDYIRAHRLPSNPLHEQGYPSIGCLPCTRAIQTGEDARAGRWPGHEKLECGIHIENGRIARLPGQR